jgi:aerobic-type carbon monoxide dehydrogenase small subunit (CoxS/CutS family)
MARFPLDINGKRSVVDVDPDTPLLWVLRDTLGLTGTKFGCGVGVCGACTILEWSTDEWSTDEWSTDFSRSRPADAGVPKGRQAVRTCQVTAKDAVGKRFTTIEGLSKDGSHPCQRAWLQEDVAQCGYCQSGMILSACALLERKPQPTDADIDAAMADHVCRCGTYVRIRRAIHTASRLQ